MKINTETHNYGCKKAKLKSVILIIIPMADNVQIIKTVLNGVSYPITAGYIAQLSGLGKTVVNSVLYAHKATEFEQLECIPPLWRVRLVQAAPNTNEGS